MSDKDEANVAGSWVEAIQPVVLVGGRSERFGRDKLREPVGGMMLVEYAMRSLRGVFGNRVKVVGECHEQVRAVADGVIPDRYPGVGPVGGIISALEYWQGPVFVLGGDMPRFGPEDIRRVARAGASSTGWLVAWATTGRAHPCAAVYARGAEDVLRDRLRRGIHRLHDAFAREAVIEVAVEESAVANINRPEEVEAWRDWDPLV